ncbi:MAG TPA: succinate dehydrogenase cytochrome b subunit [Leptospiraceae bacterium]|nr:succinate dehydrogenase cytochrome b subunit [Leptospirales bacterium]HMU83764.1 succinate dehydrogenase cytochrome b subunit [Leptospiraceae bacterium]HMW59059.1 succinate dehydrogenase cytochrome b subunit [Leptospiraceae bacterium]HMX56171.1 succinate dehydrogenase cytochrome b subunit [Leptospiraceae bacterium]HMY45097.1 succinate dehydrogenase cytochrome b subunit [Leptospiraceae bacterium]
MSFTQRIFSSSLGRKYLMAISGALLMVFLIAHMTGNLLVFAGPDAFNAYGHYLKTHPQLLWPARIGLIVLFVLHVYTGISLARENRAARPTAYAFKNTIQATLASRTMALTGLLVLAYLIYHLLHFTIGIVQPQYFSGVDGQGRHDIYTMFILGFRNPIIYSSYVLAQIVLVLHLSHASRSFFQSMGWNQARFSGAIKTFSVAYTLVIFLGFLITPTCVILNFIKLPGEL